ncbi:hypothetical protein D3C71_1340510 [compost metagenome]
MMRHHLMFCPNCRRFMHQMRLMQKTLRVMPEDALPDIDMLAERLVQERRNDQ